MKGGGVIRTSEAYHFEQELTKVEGTLGEVSRRQATVTISFSSSP